MSACGANGTQLLRSKEKTMKSNKNYWLPYSSNCTVKGMTLEHGKSLQTTVVMTSLLEMPVHQNVMTALNQARYMPLCPCIMVPNPVFRKFSLASISKWLRCYMLCLRTSNVYGGNTTIFKMDDNKWKKREEHCKSCFWILGRSRAWMVMDMNIDGDLIPFLWVSPTWFGCWFTRSTILLLSWSWDDTYFLFS